MTDAKFGLESAKHITVSELRKIDRYDLAEGKPIVIVHRGEPVCVLVPYSAFIAAQMALIVALEGLERVREPLGIVRKPS